MLPLDHAYQRICVICEFWTEILPEWEYQNARIAVPTIFLGVCIAGAIMTAVTFGIINIL